MSLAGSPSAGILRYAASKGWMRLKIHELGRLTFGGHTSVCGIQRTDAWQNAGWQAKNECGSKYISLAGSPSAGILRYAASKERMLGKMLAGKQRTNAAQNT